MNTFKIRKHFWSFGIAFGFSIAFIVTLVITIWEWIENPSGIFHNENGTNWSFVFETASSWFLPTFVNASAIGAAFHLLLSGVKKLIKFYKK